MLQAYRKRRRLHLYHKWWQFGTVKYPCVLCGTAYHWLRFGRVLNYADHLRRSRGVS